MDDDSEFEFLDQVVEEFGATAKVLLAQAESSQDLSDICYGALAAACVLYCEKLGVEDGREAALRIVRDIFAERAAREGLPVRPGDATVH